ncbi:hypothetical protein [Vibrio phage RYC]|nr:hypothetical protein [Vibrio phage RYC]
MEYYIKKREEPVVTLEYLSAGDTFRLKDYPDVYIMTDEDSPLDSTRTQCVDIDNGALIGVNKNAEVVRLKMEGSITFKEL